MDTQFKKFSVGAFAALGTYATLKWITNKKKKKENTSIEYLFFTPSTKNNLHESSYICSWFSCPVCNFKKLQNLISSAKTHLDICVCLITISELTNLVVNLFNSGVSVRIITDKSVSVDGSCAKILTFLKNHIPIKVIDYSEIMHNKFVIIDRKTVLTGSFNWTFQGLHYNFENGIIITDSNVAGKYVEYFQEVWDIPIESLKKCF